MQVYFSSVKMTLTFLCPTIKIPINHKENTGKGSHHKNELFKSIYMFTCWKVDILFHCVPWFFSKQLLKNKQKDQRECNDSLQTPEDSVLKTNWQVGW